MGNVVTKSENIGDRRKKVKVVVMPINLDEIHSRPPSPEKEIFLSTFKGVMKPFDFLSFDDFPPPYFESSEDETETINKITKSNPKKIYKTMVMRPIRKALRRCNSLGNIIKPVAVAIAPPIAPPLESITNKSVNLTNENKLEPHRKAPVISFEQGTSFCRSISDLR